MSKELVRSGQKYLATHDDSTIKREAGKGLVTVGGGGLALSVLAGMLPIVTLPVLLFIVVVLGGYLWVKG
jgi:hypothetical protein